MLAESGSTAMNVVYLVSAVAPVVIVGIIAWVFFRAARRNDERERAEAEAERARR